MVDTQSDTTSNPDFTSSSSGPTDAETSHRLDEFLQAAYDFSCSSNESSSSSSSSNRRKWQTQWKYWAIISSCGMANASDASEVLCLSYMLSDEVFASTILEHTPWKGGLVAAAVFLGMLVGGLLSGTLGDWLGRRPMLLMGLACNFSAGILSCLAPNVYHLSLLRCIAGVGIGTTVPQFYTLATELAPPSHRGFCVTLVCSFWTVGNVFVALTAMLLLEHLKVSWRLFAMACALPSLLAFVLCKELVPESPRFLAVQHNHQSALDVANLLAQKMNSDNSSFTSTAVAPLMLEELQWAFPPRSLNHSHVSTPSSWWGIVRMAKNDFVVSARQLYTTQLRNTTWPLKIVWFSLGFGNHGIVTWINTLFVQVGLKNVYFNALLFAFSPLPANIFTALYLDTVSRCKMLTYSILASVACLMGFALGAFSKNAFWIVASACAFQCCTTVAWTTSDTMTGERFPTTVRSTGTGICVASGRIGAMGAQFINGALVAEPVRLLLVASVALLLGALAPTLLPGGNDMTGQPVSDFAADDVDRINHQPLIHRGNRSYQDNRSHSSCHAVVSDS